MITYNITKEQYNDTTKTFTLPMGSIYPFVKYERENDRKLPPEILLISPTGNEMVFTNPSNLFGNGMLYFSNNLKLKLLWL